MPIPIPVAHSSVRHQILLPVPSHHNPLPLSEVLKQFLMRGRVYVQRLRGRFEAGSCRIEGTRKRCGVQRTSVITSARMGIMGSRRVQQNGYVCRVWAASHSISAIDLNMESMCVHQIKHRRPLFYHIVGKAPL
jgi:hypothetical protein